MKEYLKMTKGRVAILAGMFWVIIFTALFSQQESYATKDVQLVFGFALGCMTYMGVLILLMAWINFKD
jgi:hypothetical protein